MRYILDLSEGKLNGKSTYSQYSSSLKMGEYSTVDSVPLDIDHYTSSLELK